jgi:hypothetical protein
MARVVSGMERDWFVGNRGAAAFDGAGDCGAAVALLRAIKRTTLKANMARTAIIPQRFFIGPSCAMLRL